MKNRYINLKASGLLYKHILLLLIFLSSLFLLNNVTGFESSENHTLYNYTQEKTIRIYNEFNEFYFPPHFYSPPFNVAVKQVDSRNLAVVIEIVNEVLTAYESNVHKIIDGIYIADSYSIYDRSFDVFSLGRNLYIAAYKNGEKVNQSTIKEKLHGEIHKILFDYYPKIVSDSNWMSKESFTEKYSDDLLKGKTLQELHALGFLNTAAIKSPKHDFIQYGLWDKMKKFELDSLAEEFSSISKKYEKYRDIVYTFQKKENCPSSEINGILIDFYEKHGIEVDICYNVANFPRIWSKTGRVTASQISYDNSIMLLERIDTVLSGMKSLPLYSIVKKIYLVDDLKNNEENEKVLLSRNSIFLGINEQVEGSQGQEEINEIVLDFTYNIAELIRVNFHWLFPKDEWAKLLNIEDPNDIEFFFNEKYNKEILEYFTCEILIRSNQLSHLPLQCNDLNKRKLISIFFQKIEKWISNIYADQNNFNVKLNDLEQQYGINILWDFSLFDPLLVLPSTFRVEENILYIHAYRTLPLIEIFLNSYPDEFIKREVGNIVLAASMNYVNSNSDIGGTYEASSKTLFLSNFGNDDSFIQGVLHHEFAHLILSKYKNKFDLDSWLSVNPSGFRYNVGGINPEFSPFDSGVEYYDLGFINNHSTTNFDEDFAEFHREYHMNREELKELIKNYDRLERKYLILESFHGKILYQVD